MRKVNKFFFWYHFIMNSLKELHNQQLLQYICLHFCQKDPFMNNSQFLNESDERVSSVKSIKCQCLHKRNPLKGFLHRLY